MIISCAWQKESKSLRNSNYVASLHVKMKLGPLFRRRAWDFIGVVPDKLATDD